MKKFRFNFLFYIIIGFAIIGFFHTIIYEPSKLIVSLLSILLFALIFYMIYGLFISRKIHNYVSNLKQNKKKRKKPKHLRVINGGKSDKKD